MSGLSCPRVKHLARLKHIARCPVDKLECASQFPEQKAPTKIAAFTDADWASNVHDRRSVDVVHLFFGRTLLQTSTCTDSSQQRGVGVPQSYSALPYAVYDGSGDADGQIGSTRNELMVRKRTRETSGITLALAARTDSG